MRRMDYPIAKTKELNIQDKEWFLNEDTEYYLKKKLPNGIYHLTGYDKIGQENPDIYLYSKNDTSVGCKALLLITSHSVDTKDLTELLSGAFDNGLIDKTPSFSLNSQSHIYSDDNIYLIVKDGIVYLTVNVQE